MKVSYETHVHLHSVGFRKLMPHTMSALSSARIKAQRKPGPALPSASSRTPGSIPRPMRPAEGFRPSERNGQEPSCRGRAHHSRRVLLLRSEIAKCTDEALDFVRRVVVNEADAQHAAFRFDA